MNANTYIPKKDEPMKPMPLVNAQLTKEQAVTLAKVIYKYASYSLLSEEEEWLKESMDELIDLLGLNPKAIANAAVFDIFVRNPERFTITKS